MRADHRLSDALESNTRDHIEERIFYIKLKITQKELKIDKNSQFAKIIENEYATKYLERLGIEPTQRNIGLILKKYPLKNCEVTAEWNGSGLYADVIKIVARARPQKKDRNEVKADMTEEILQKLDVQKMSLKNLKDKVKPDSAQNEEEEPVTQQKEVEDESKIKFKLNFDIEEIKKNYLFPFNQSFQRRMNINLRNSDKMELPNVNSTPVADQDKFLILESKVFTFPFLHIDLEQTIIRELQKPPTIMPTEIHKILKSIAKNFPKDVIPTLKPVIKQDRKQGYSWQHREEQKNRQQSDVVQTSLSSRHIVFNEIDVNEIFQMIQSQEMVKFVGLFTHFTYWMVFGITQPIQIEVLNKKQMFINMFEIIEYFSSKTKQKRIWMEINYPMILLTLKMSIEYIFRNGYSLFQDYSGNSRNTPGQVAMDKIFYLIERVFDQNNLFCRFIFLESEFNTKNLQKKGIVNDRKFMQKRIFGISPYMDLLINNPEDGRSRAIVARQHDIDSKNFFYDIILQVRDKVLNIGDNKNSSTSSPTKIIVGNKELEEKNIIEKSQKQKMFNILLSKMNQDIEGVLGKKNLLSLKNQ